VKRENETERERGEIKARGFRKAKLVGQNRRTFCRKCEQVGVTLLPDASFQGRIRSDAITKHKSVPLTVSKVRKRDSKGRFRWCEKRK
jgi:hypothetical protein